MSALTRSILLIDWLLMYSWLPDGLFFQSNVSNLKITPKYIRNHGHFTFSNQADYFDCKQLILHL